MEYKNKNLIEEIGNISKKINIKNIDKIIDFTSDNVSKIFNHDLKDIINIPASRKIIKGQDYLLNGEMKIATSDIDLGQEESLCKKNFADIMTDFISSEKIFNDSNMEYVARFQYLVNQTFNKSIEHYIEYLGDKYKKRYDKNTDIFFSYKGGTTMKIVFEKYKSIFEGLTNFKDISSKFKRSDSDYSIIINPNISDNKKNNIFLEVYKDMNRLCAWCLIFIKGKILEHPNFFMPLISINNSDIRDLLIKMNQRLAEIKINKDNDFDFCEKVRKINSFIGMSYFDKQYFMDGEVIPALNDKLVETILSDLDPSEPKFNEFKDNRFVSTKRKNFYLTWNLVDKNKRYLGMIPEDCDINNNNDIYLSINETNEYPSGDPDNKVGDTMFCLQRLKINFITYYKTLEADGTYKYGFINCPSELVDVSIMKQESIDLLKIYEHIDIEFRNYKYIKFGLEINYRSYTNYGHISDLSNILFSQFKYPWLAKKYEKRVSRVLFFFILDLITIYNYHNFEIIFKAIKKTIDETIVNIINYKKLSYHLETTKIKINTNYEKTLALLKKINPKFGENTGSYKFINYLYILIDKLDSDTSDKFIKFFILIKDFLTIINSHKEIIKRILKEKEEKILIASERKETASIISASTNSSGSLKYKPKKSVLPITISQLGGEYYDKYIKYKLKYLKLKNLKNKSN